MPKAVPNIRLRNAQKQLARLQQAVKTCSLQEVEKYRQGIDNLERYIEHLQKEQP